MDRPEVRIPTLRVRALPTSTNAYGRVQAGWLMNQIDMAGSLDAERLSRGPVTTVAVNTFQFAAPILLGDVVDLYVERLRIGQKSITLKITVEAERIDGSHEAITEVVATYVAVGCDGKSRLLGDI
ncbi:MULTISPECIES: acyl-CoA thioesterase [Chromobacterium]|uniref:Acyl-CoA thioesterase n=2 Tax=Chromobacterium TaxID=535 RepID=A0ABS3GKP2_9NEIS|nr:MULTISPECIES: hotdog domain-containing protein [Chromobacterium]AXT46840.1 acyl-CoA thioesterase [Chromobacterium rhizoryzae]MBK0414227.1 acyl-CoA thioesterase [Chromobacterium haemolyticum]MBO0415606.1 acyl-CoA thioesterase [Chromobacterium haemolyticum]MBO0498878.1 acyl-CoA thioesterase [Chromobacterium haemolyticum]PTU70998.1 acyl-CoA thioesterase [Chromobacterium haemolyticum]